MAGWNDYGYMEGDQLGKPYDLRLIARLVGYAKPYRRMLALAAVLILAGVLLDLTLPYITRYAIDDHIVRQAVSLRLERAPAELAQEFRSAAGDRAWAGPQGQTFMAEAAWRKLDPRLTARLRKAGAVEDTQWHLTHDGPATDKLASAHPDLFVRAGGHWLLSRPDLKKLSTQEIHALRGPDAWGLVRLALAYLVVAAGICLLSYAQQMILERAGQEMMYAIRRQLYHHLLTRSLAFHGANPVGKLVTRLTNDVQNIIEMYRTSIVALCQDLFLLVGIVAMLLWLDLSLALTVLALLPVIGVMAYAFSRLAREAFRRLQGHLGRINARLQETMSGLAVVKLLRAEAVGKRNFARLNQDYYDAGMRQVWVLAFFMPLTELFSSLAVALILWYGGGEVIQGRISLGTLAAFIFYMQMFFRPVRDMAEKYNILQAAMASAERIFVLMDDERGLADPEEGAAGEPGPGEVRFEGVTFGYDPERPVLKDLSFSIPPGQRWAVVGPTGAGKTSLVNLLLRFYDPQAGRVLIDGHDLRGLSRAELARRAALVPQEVFLFSGTVAENISLHRPEVSDDDLEAALAVSGAGEMLSELPQGLETPLGEGARKLSAGQRQLLALARALAGSPRVLVLDEATSSVDPGSERRIQAALPRVMEGRTSLVVAHRLSTVRQADRILVMRAGQIVEQGNHAELMAAGGFYARLVQVEDMKRRETISNGDGA